MGREVTTGGWRRLYFEKLDHNRTEALLYCSPLSLFMNTSRLTDFRQALHMAYIYIVKLVISESEGWRLSIAFRSLLIDCFEQHLLKTITVRHRILLLVHQSDNSVLCKKPQHAPLETQFIGSGDGPNSSMQNSQMKWGEQWKMSPNSRAFCFAFISICSSLTPKEERKLVIFHQLCSTKSQIAFYIYIETLSVLLFYFHSLWIIFNTFLNNVLKI